MMNHKEGITSKQLMTFLIASQIGCSILFLPSKLTEIVGHDGWIVVLFSGIIFTLLIAVIALLLNRFKDNTIIEINKIVYGKYIGTLINLIFLLYCFFGSFIYTRVFVDIIKIALLRRTPYWVITLLFYIITMYMCWYGLKVICRFHSLIYIIISFSLVIFILVNNDMMFTFLLPINETGFLNITKALPSTIPSFLGGELLIFIYSYIKDKNKIIKHSILANLCTTLFYTIVVVVITVFFGESFLKHLLLPLFNLSGSYRAPVFERIDLFFISFWLYAMSSTIISYSYCAYNSFQKIFKLKKTFFSLTTFFMISMVLSLTPKDFTTVLNLLDLLGSIGIGIILFSAMTFILSIFKKKSGDTIGVQSEA